jgi:transposase InsO family protein
MSRVLGVSRSGYYDWLGREPSARAQADERLKVAIQAAHRKNRETYGPRRLQPEPAAEGFVAGRDRIARLRRELGLRCKQKRRLTKAGVSAIARTPQCRGTSLQRHKQGRRTGGMCSVKEHMLRVAASHRMPLRPVIPKA